VYGLFNGLPAATLGHFTPADGKPLIGVFCCSLNGEYTAVVSFVFDTLRASAAGTNSALGVGGRSLLKRGVELGLSTSFAKADVMRGDGLRCGERKGRSGVPVLLSIVGSTCKGEYDFDCNGVVLNVEGESVALL